MVTPPETWCPHFKGTMRAYEWQRVAGTNEDGTCKEESEHARMRKKIYRRAYRIKNQVLVNLQESQWAHNNPEKKREAKRRYHAKPKNKETVAAWRRNNPFKVSESQKRHTRKHPVARRLRCMTWYAAKRGGNKKCNTTEKLTSMNFEQLTEYLENNDHGLKLHGHKVHIDHIRPLADFKNLHCEFEMRTACCYLNLQLLTASQNLHKSDTFCYTSWASSDRGKQLIQLGFEWREKEGKDCSTERTFRRCCCADPKPI